MPRPSMSGFRGIRKSIVDGLVATFRVSGGSPVGGSTFRVSHRKSANRRAPTSLMLRGGEGNGFGSEYSRWRLSLLLQLIYDETAFPRLHGEQLTFHNGSNELWSSVPIQIGKLVIDNHTAHLP